MSVCKRTNFDVPLGSPSVSAARFPGGMRARQLIDGAAFEPERVIGQAFDAAWKEIAPNFGDDQQVIDAARLRLANAVLSIADEDSCDVEVLKRAALRRMALDYRLRDDLDFAKPVEAKSQREKIKI
jgi:hypothetical protein